MAAPPTSFTVYNDDSLNNLSVNTLNTSNLEISGKLSASHINNNVQVVGYSAALAGSGIQYISGSPGQAPWTAGTAATWDYLVGPPNSLLLRVTYTPDNLTLNGGGTNLIAAVAVDHPTYGLATLAAAQAGTGPPAAGAALVGAPGTQVQSDERSAINGLVGNAIPLATPSGTPFQNPMVVDYVAAITAGQLKITLDFISLD